jgi:hypothetical protein
LRLDWLARARLMQQLTAGLVFALVGLVGPGLGLQAWARLAIDPSLVLPLGAALAAFAYWLSLVTGWPWLFPVLVLLSTAGLLRRRALVADAVPARALVAPAVALVGLLAVAQYAGNRPAADGGFFFDPMGDQPLHAGIAWELTLPYPPQVPGLAGIPLRYHYGADLVRAAALRWTGLRPYDALNRVEPTLWALGLMLVLASLTARLGGGRLAVALVPWTVLASDFSFAWAPFRGAVWWTDLFRGNLLISLAFTNPVVPALMLALGALAALSRFEKGEGRPWLAMALVQATALPFFKVFLGAQLGLALAIAAAGAAVRRRSVTGADALAPLGLLVAGLPGLLWLVTGSTGQRVAVTFAPLRMVRDSLVNLRTDDVSPLSLGLIALPWLVASLGLRVIGVRRAGEALVGSSGAGTATAALALVGWPLGLLFHASARDINQVELPSATIYFVEQSGAVLWIFTALAVAAWCARGRRVIPILAGAALLSFPSTLEFAWRKANERLLGVPAAYVRAIRAIEKDSQPGDRVLQRPGGRYPPLPVVLAGRRVLYERFTVYLSQFAPPDELTRRHEMLFRFFRTTDREEALAIARALGATHVCLYGPDRVRFDGAGILKPLHEEAEARSYRLEWPEGAQPGAGSESRASRLSP